MQSEFAVRHLSRLDVICMKRSSSACPISGCLQPTFFARNDCLFGKQMFMNIKMNSNIINVETSFRHVNHSAAFVSGRLLRFNIPEFHQMPITCLCVLSNDRVNNYYPYSDIRGSTCSYCRTCCDKAAYIISQAWL